MKKSTALTLAGLMAISGAASASMSRWNGFGESSLFISDVQDIWTLPGVVASNANATYFEFGNGGSTDYTNFGYNNIANSGNAWGGAHMALGPGVLAIWGGRPWNELSNLMSFSIPNSGIASSSFPTPNQQIDLIYAFAVNDKLTLGIGVNRAVNADTQEYAYSVTEKYEESTNDFGFSLGAEIKGVGPVDLLEVGLQYNMISGVNSANNGGGFTDKVTMGGADMDLRIGGDIKGDKNSFQRVEIGLKTDSLNIKDEPNTAAPSGSFVESKNSALAWNLGWAKGMSNDKGMGLGGFVLTGLSQSKDEAGNFGREVNKTNISNLNLAFVCAGEGKVKDWLTARAGLSSNLFQSNTEVDEYGNAGSMEKDTYWNSGSSNTTISTGLSLNFGDITIDGVLNQDLLYTGTYFVSGIPAGLFSQVSATWAWGGAKE